jgi:transcriptional regulator with XRE-family HTH domain
MKIESHKDSAILPELGLRLTQTRLDHNFTQEDLARTGAVSKRTVERLETGQSVQVSNFVRKLICDYGSIIMTASTASFRCGHNAFHKLRNILLASRFFLKARHF